MPHELSPLERSVIALSLNDLPASLVRRGRIARWVYGQASEQPPLADPRLEALRRYAILRRMHGYALPEQEREQLRRAGYDQRKMDEIHHLLPAVRMAPWQVEHSPDPMGQPARLASALRHIPLFLRLPTERKSMLRQPKACVQLVVTLAISALACSHGAAHAQQPPSDGEPPAEAENEDLPAWLGWIIGPSSPGQGNQFALGVGAAYMPAYIGSKDYRFQPLPAIDIKYGRFFVTFQDGIGANFINTENLTIGAGFTMADNYRAKDVPDGIGKLSFGVGGRGFVTIRQFGFEATAGVTKILAGSTGGVIADFNLSRPIMVNDRLFINPSVSTTWANRKHNNRYFGVNATQSEASGLPEFSVGSGFMDAKAEVGVQYRLTEHIGVGLVGGVTTLLGDVKNSPIVEKKTAPFGIGFVSYSF